MGTRTFVVERNDLRSARWVDSERSPLPADGVRLRIDSFALTSNNITYAAFGEAMHYWDFFPTGDAQTGCIPVWGFADVLESNVSGVVPGERYYGYYPMADEVVLQPARVGSSGFADDAPHRRALHAVYNQYIRCSADPGYRPALEAQQALLKPLFITSFLIDDFLFDNACFGAQTVVLSSASSKTAYGTAHCLSLRRGAAAAVRVVGLTSADNLPFTQRLGVYDEVLPYDALSALHGNTPAVYVDFSGNAPLRARIHAHFNDKLMYSCSVGGTHWDALGSGGGLPGPRPTLFFAPAQIKKRHADWGAAELQVRVAHAWDAFMSRVTDSENPWLQVVHHRGAAEVAQTYAVVLAGRAGPEQGHILSV